MRLRRGLRWVTANAETHVTPFSLLSVVSSFFHYICTHLVPHFFNILSVQIRTWKLKESQQKHWRKTAWTWCFPPKRKSPRKWNLMKGALWRKTTVRISLIILKNADVFILWKGKRNGGRWVTRFCVFPALDDDEGKGGDGISFSSSTGPAWAGSERDYTYDEVGKLSGETDVHLPLRWMVKQKQISHVVSDHCMWHWLDSMWFQLFHVTTNT